MSHEKVYMYFKTYLPKISEVVKEWFPNGKNSIRVRTSNRTDFIFTFYNPDDWCFETLDSYIRKMKGGAVVKC